MRGMIFRLAVLVAMLAAGPVLASAQKSRANVSAAEVTGTYRMNFRGKYARFCNTIELQAVGRGKVRVAMDLVFPYTMRNGEAMVNMGGLDAEAAIAGDVATYNSEGDEKCTIAIKFVRRGTIRVTQNSEDSTCGFGHNVTANGTYRKVSNRKPKFETRP